MELHHSERTQDDSAASTAAADLKRFFGAQDRYAHAGNVAALLDRAQSMLEEGAPGQVLEILPNGEPAWLRPAHRLRVVEETHGHDTDDERYTITWEGRRALRCAELFGTES
ncbi:MAG: hypothetical protein JOZ81_01965 [Chloroflexi bacterium]|nr:hypothetical protein [Chloroflexota bacterium]